MLVMCVNNDRVPSSLAIKTAFFQGRGFNKEVPLEPPMEANVTTGHVWRLKKPVYGLNEASLKCYESLMDFLGSHGGMRTTIDPCLVMLTLMRKLCGMMAIPVDDICYAGTRKWTKRFIPELGKRIPFASEKQNLGHSQKKENDRVATVTKLSVACPKTPSKVRVLGARDLCAPQPQRKGTHAQRRTKESERKQNRHKQHRQQWPPRRKYVTCHATPKCAATKSTTKTAPARKTNRR